MEKEVLFDKQALDSMRIGLDTVANAVSSTLGPKGRNVFIADAVHPKITNDGKTIAESITLSDRFEELGGWLVKNASAQTNDDAGDGTTTTSLLLQSIVHEAMKRPENAMEVSHSLKDALPSIISSIQSRAKKVKDIRTVAYISSEDEVLADVITEVVKKVGEKGTILVEEGTEPKITHQIVHGYEAHVGFMSPYFATIPQKMTAEYKNIGVFCTEKKISNVGDIESLFVQLKESKMHQLVIVCEDIDPQMLGVFVQNRLQGIFNALVIRATGALLQDIAAVVGATPVSDTNGVTFENVRLDTHIGHAQKVVCDEKRTIFLSEANTAKKHADRLEAMAKNNPNKFEAKKYMERVAKLKGGMAVIRVGSSTTVDMGYLKDKAEDAVHATQAALEEGVVEGGGMTLWKIARDMKPKTIGEHILKEALQAPFKKILSNAGLDYTQIVLNLPPNQGFNAKTGKYVDMFKDGVLDPAKVERCAVTNALLNAAQFITAYVAIVDKKEEKHG